MLRVRNPPVTHLRAPAAPLPGLGHGLGGVVLPLSRERGLLVLLVSGQSPSMDRGFSYFKPKLSFETFKRLL